MQSLKERIISKKENIYTSKKNKESIVIKVKNTCHFFKIFFIISPANFIPAEFHPNKLIISSEEEKEEEEKLIIKAELLNKNESFFNSNNEEIEFSEKYYEIYTLAELKNNIKGFEWYSELSEFKEAFLNGIKNNNYELLIIKKLLLLSINIVNIFGINKNSFIILRPFEDNKILNNDKNVNIKINTENYNLKDNYVLNPNKNKNYSINQKFEYTPVTVIVENNNNCKKEFLDKKRAKTKKNRVKQLSEISNKALTNCYNKIENSENLNNENSQNIFTKIDNFFENLKNDNKTKLPDFEIDGLFRESSIIKSEEEESLIGDMISMIKIKKYRLLYRASRDGDSSNKFHKICDNHNKLIVLIETKQGLRFGGYTSSKFKGSAHMKRDNNAFLFSLDLKKVYNIIPEEYAIYCYPNSGPSFCKGSLYIPDFFFEKPGKTGVAGGPYHFEKDYELNNGQKQFFVKELEIFQVKIEDLLLF